MSKLSLSKACVGAGCTAVIVAMVAAIAISFPVPVTRTSATNMSSHSQALKTSAADRGNLQAKFAALPLAFEENVGQTDPQVKYMARGSGYTLFLTSSDAVLSLASSSPARMPRPREIMEERFAGYSRKEPRSIQRQSERAGVASSAASSLRMHLVNGRPEPTAEGRGLLAGKVNYFIGNDPHNWHEGVREFSNISYSGIYPGVDLVYHGEQKQLEFDFIVAAHASASPIRLSFDGAQKIELDKSGNLLLHTSGGDITLRKPVAFQDGSHGRETIDADFILKANHEVGFALGNYDKSRELVIDPLLTYGTYLGGNQDDEAYGIAVDANGNSYVTGESDSTSGFPGSNPSDGGYDCFVVKINADGSLGYTTFVGGSGDDLGSAIALNNKLTAGTVFVAGITTSTDLPVTAGVVQSNSGAPPGTNCITGVGPGAPCTDAFVFELNPSGTPSYLTYLGGANDDGAFGVAVDGSGNAYVAGFTFSTDFPTASPVDSQLNDNQNSTFEDGFVTEINPNGTAYVYSTYLGGANNDFASAIAVDANGSAYVTGGTTSAGPPNGFPVTTGAFQPQCGTDGTCNAGSGLIFSDAFITKFVPGGTSLAYSTYLGGSSDDVGMGIGLDSSANVYVTGETRDDNSVVGNGDFPIVGGFEANYGNGNTSAFSNGFVSELSPGGQGSSDLKYSSYLGGSTADAGMAIAVDGSGNAYVTGSTRSFDFPTTNSSKLNGNSDAFVSYVASGGGSLTYSTFLGGSGNENFDASTASFLGAGINLSLSGSTNTGVYATGTTDSPSTSSSTSFPVTAAALESSYGGGSFDGFEATFADFKISATAPSAISAGSSATSTITLTSPSYTNSVSLSCSVSGTGSPLPACGSFSPASVTPTAAGATSMLSITTTGASAQLSLPSKKFFYALWLPVGALVLVGIVSPSRRRKLSATVLMAVAIGLMLLPACGGGGSSSNGGGGGGGGGGGCTGCTPSGSYRVTVTGVGNDAAKTTQSTSFTLTVN